MLPPRLPFSSAEGGASRAVRLCARSGDRRRDDEDNRVELLLVSLLRDYIVADGLLLAAWCTRTKGRTREVDREEEERRERVRKRTARNSRWV